MYIVERNNASWRIFTKSRDSVIFLLGDNGHVACISELDIIKEDIKSWLQNKVIPEYYSGRTKGQNFLEIDIEGDPIKEMMRDKKLKELGI